MSDGVARVAWYRFRTTLHRRGGGYVTIALLIGLLGGLAMGAVAGARRTQAAYPAALARTHASALSFTISYLSGITDDRYSPALADAMARVPGVVGVGVAPLLIMATLRPDGAADISSQLENEVLPVGSVGGEHVSQDQMVVLQGRLADPDRPGEFVTTAEGARLLGWHVGQTVRIGTYSIAQTNSPAFGTPRVRPLQRFDETLVGTVQLTNAVVTDDVDRLPTYAVFTPALSSRLAVRSSFYPTYDLRLAPGRDVEAVEQAVERLLPAGATYSIHLTSVTEGQVERATKPESIAFGAFGLVAGLAVLVIAGQAIGRQVRSGADSLGTLRALGAGPAVTTADSLIGTLGAVVAGSLLAAGVAVALSPLAPIGAVRQVDPDPGFAADGAVLGTGLAVLVVGLGALSVVLARRASRAASARDAAGADGPPSSVVAAAARAGLPPPAVAGVRFSLERGRPPVPVRSAMVGAVAAVALVVATLTFGSGLSTLVSHPALYGWNWSDALVQESGGTVPPFAEHLLDHDRDVAAWTGYNFADLQIDGRTVPALRGGTHPALSPPILSGHPLDGAHQIVLGAATMADLHVRVGDTVVVSYGKPQSAPAYVPPTRVVVVGTVTLPAIGNAGTLHPSMGTGAQIADAIEPPALQRALASPDPNLDGPAIAVVRLRAGVSASAGRASLERIAAAATRHVAADPQAGGAYQVISVQRPAEIVNYRATGSTPARLAAALAAGAALALALALAASVRGRRRDLAVLKTLGFTQRQLAATVAWQASVAAIVGVVVGVPVGIALGRWLWTVFAREIYAVPRPSVPTGSVVLVAVAALVLANVAAAVPGLVAARTPTTILLRAE
ncbi:MAG TPA: FtsX-like permease family protein [Acidimicrobiales bacterium]|nr:FtsX-like permease family protein [Acidimicrobiales bacterium]